MSLETVVSLFSVWSVEILLALIAGGILYYFFQRPRPRITTTLEACVPVVSVAEKHVPSIIIMYDGHPVPCLQAVEFSIKNTGNRVIKKADFDGPLTVLFAGPLAHEPELISTAPSDLEPEVAFDNEEHRLALEPLLLNKGDSMRFRALVISKESEPLTVRGRVAGIKNLSVSIRRETDWSVFCVCMAFLMTIGLLALLFGD